MAKITRRYSDVKDATLGTQGGATAFAAIIEHYSHYYPFGMEKPSMAWDKGGYRYGYQGQEMDNEIQGIGNAITYEYRITDPRTGRFYSVDPLLRKYPHNSPYAFSENDVISCIELEGLETFFIAGAGNDVIGWNYKKRFNTIFREEGFDFRVVNASHSWEITQQYNIPPVGDIMFTINHRKSAYTTIDPEDGSIPKAGRVVDGDLTANNAVKEILKIHKQYSTRQLNLIGYSYGSVMQAHVALSLADKGIQVDNLVLVGSPIPDDSELMKELTSNPLIKNVYRHDIPGDFLSNPKDDDTFFKGAEQNSDESGPHFDLARPDNPKTPQNEAADANDKIRSLAKSLKVKGIK